MPPTPSLPPNISIYNPPPPHKAHHLVTARLFTRLTTTLRAEPDTLSGILSNSPGLSPEFYVAHGNAVLIFDGGGGGNGDGDGIATKDEEEDGDEDGLHAGAGAGADAEAAADAKEESSQSARLQDVHHGHFRAVCLALRDADVGLDVGRCVHDVGCVGEAGFQVEGMEGGEVLVVDLMVGSSGGSGSDEEEG